jgi:CubicO group peptidase (beta-lactamase class C family)
MRIALLLLVAVPAVVQGQRPMTATDSTIRAIDKVFDAWRSTDGPGCAVGVRRPDGFEYQRGYGMANLETGTPIRPASIFHVASVSKQFTAMAIMLLARDGKLSVDDDIRKYLPEIPDYGTPITIRHLLTHTSGLRDQWELIGLARGRFEEDRITEADVMDIVPRQKALNFTPGSEYAYSNTGFTLLGVIVKRVSGQSLKDFAAERIFRPLGMTSTHFHDDYTMLVPGRTSAYEPRADSSHWSVAIPNYDTYGATSLFTTVGDLLKWEANFDKPVVGDAALLARMQTVTPLTGGDTSSYGFGLVIGQYRGARVVDHNGADAGYRSYVGRFPDLGTSIAIACNGATANTTLLAHGVADAVLGGRLTTAAVAGLAPAVRADTAALRRLAGVYVQPNTMQIIELSLVNGALQQGKQASSALVPIGENRFRLMTQPVELVFGSGEHPGLEVHPPSGRPIRFEWRAPVAANRAMLNGYAGTYVSEELGGAVYRVTATDSTIELRTGTAEPISARLVVANTFVGNGYTFQFFESKGKVDGFDVWNGRIRKVRFARAGGR